MHNQLSPMGLFRNSNFLGTTIPKNIKNCFLAALTILLLSSYLELNHKKSHFFVNTVDLLIEQTKKQIYTKKMTFDLQSRNQYFNI